MLCTRFMIWFHEKCSHGLSSCNQHHHQHEWTWFLVVQKVTEFETLEIFMWTITSIDVNMESYCYYLWLWRIFCNCYTCSIIPISYKWYIIHRILIYMIKCYCNVYFSLFCMKCRKIKKFLLLCNAMDMWCLRWFMIWKYNGIISKLIELEQQRQF